MANPVEARAVPSPRVQRKRRRRRDEILHSALRAFREGGYHGTTLEQIARSLGLSKATLYHYFPDKESILFECHRRALRELDDAVVEADRRFERAPDRLAYLIRQHVRVMTDTLAGSPLAFEVPALSPEHQREVVAARDRYERALRTVIEEGVRRGEFRAPDAKIATFAILGAINWIARWYDPDGAIAPPELGARFAEHLVGGLTNGRRSASEA